MSHVSAKGIRTFMKASVSTLFFESKHKALLLNSLGTEEYNTRHPVNSFYCSVSTLVALGFAASRDPSIQTPIKKGKGEGAGVFSRVVGQGVWHTWFARERDVKCLNL